MIALICGKREEGKTTLGLYLARLWSPRIIIFDSRRQFECGRVVTSMMELADVLDDGGESVIIYQPFSGHDEEEIIDVAEQVRSMGEEHWPIRRFTFLIDEAALVARTGAGVKALRRMITFVRMDTVQVLFLCHRPANIHPDFRSLITDLYAFLTTDSRDLEWLRDADLTEADIETIRYLPRHYFAHKVVGTRQELEVNSQPETWKVPYRQEAYV